MIGGSNRLFSAEDTARYLGVSIDTLYRRWREWGLTAHHVGRQLKFRGRDVEAWLDRNKVE